MLFCIIRAELVSLEELEQHMTQIYHAPDTSKVAMICGVLAKMDFDHDGAVEVDQVLHVLHLLHEEIGGVSPKLFEEVVQMMAKEEKLESAQLIQRALKTTQINPRSKLDGESESKSNPVDVNSNSKLYEELKTLVSSNMLEKSEGQTGGGGEVAASEGGKQVKHSQ